MTFWQQEKNRWAVSATLMFWLGGVPLVALADSGTESLPVDHGTIHLTLAGDLPVPKSEVDDWVKRAATAISQFYGKYPVKSVDIDVSSANSGAVRDGMEIGGDRISIKLGSQTTTADLVADWMMTHEMFHLSQPSLDDRYSWMSEGMADYLEPVARVRIGQITKDRFWKDLVEGMPQGLPGPGDRGLDHTHTWGRTYWGGSLFWLLADIRVRQQTNNAKSVRDAATAVLDAGGDGSQDWTIDRLLAAYDRGSCTSVFTALHDEMGNKPANTDLAALWKSLGVIYSQSTGDIRFDDTAPLAAVRRGITGK
jgi:hypothetical protein